VTDSLRDDIRADLKQLFVGDRTLGDSFLPPLVFVATNAVWSLGPASAAALAMGGGVAAWRIRRGQQVAYALAGIAAIGFAAFLALRSGRAETYFLPGILSAAGWAVLALISMLVRRPLAAWTSWATRRWPLAWYWRNDVRPAYTEVTAIWAFYFAGRALLQWVLFANEQPELLAAAKVATSWPLILPLLIVSYVYGTRRLDRLGGPNVAEFESGADPPFQGGQRGF
jgi:hypothetical protein